MFLTCPPLNYRRIQMNRIPLAIRRFKVTSITILFLYFTAFAYAVDKDCWGDFFEGTQYSGKHLFIEGQTKLENLSKVNGENWEREVVEITFLSFGPIGTYAINDNVALDAYYNLRPTGFGSRLILKSPSGSSGDETYYYYGFGISNALGVAFRYKALNIGLEYVFGSIKSDGTYSGPNDLKLESQKIVNNNFRILLGVKL